jgi:hypothetical protein
MRVIALVMVLLAGCCHTRCCKKKVVKHTIETGVCTSVYPDAPSRLHPNPCDKVDLSAKMKWEW